MPRETLVLAHAQRFGQLSGCASNCAYRDSFSIYASLQPKFAADYADLLKQKQDGTADYGEK
jgi:hypothetical protein